MWLSLCICRGLFKSNVFVLGHTNQSLLFFRYDRTRTIPKEQTYILLITQIFSFLTVFKVFNKGILLDYTWKNSTKPTTCSLTQYDQLKNIPVCSFFKVYFRFYDNKVLLLNNFKLQYTHWTIMTYINKDVTHICKIYNGFIK